MARVGGRNTVAAWLVGVVCAAIVGVLIWIAAPLLPATLAFLDPQQTSAPVAGATDGAEDEAITECRDLYPAPLWRAMVGETDAILTQTTAAPSSIAAEGFISAISPQALFSCEWTSAEGAVTTTYGSAPTDAGSLATSALPALGYDCAAIGARVRCTYTADDQRETIEVGGGIWLSTLEDGWLIDDAPAQLADVVWAE